MMELTETEKRNRIRGCMIGGAAGDALGYPIEFWSEDDIFAKYGSEGIRSYTCDPKSGRALISDDTQMSLFTANDILFGQTRGCTRGIGGAPSSYAEICYGEWYATQTETFEEYQARKHQEGSYPACWLTDVPGLFSDRAPGTTCMKALSLLSQHKKVKNNSKGCGGVMRVAPLGTVYPEFSPEMLAAEGAEMAKITHQHPLGYMPAAMLVHMIHQMIFDRAGKTLRVLVEEAAGYVAKEYRDNPYTDELTAIIRKSIGLSENDDTDLHNIHALGEGKCGEDALAIAVYCALRHEHDFSAGIIAAVNHRGDSDSTGAITGNILGAWLGYSAIGQKWLKDLELKDVILEMADDLCDGCPLTEYGGDDKRWEQKYIRAGWTPKEEQKKPPVFFWHEYEANGEFSNWYEAPFEIDDFVYDTNEQYMMARKARMFHDAAHYTEILRTRSPEKCKDLGRKVAPFDSASWAKVACDAVKQANRAKFIQHPELMKLLLATGDAVLVEASPKDSIWGIAMSAADAAGTAPESWPGKNQLGRILMELRDEFRAALPKMPEIKVVFGDITGIRADAIVNAADRELSGGGGVDKAIHLAAGPEMKAECGKIGTCPTGMTRITGGFRLPCTYVLHTVGPKWKDGNESERELLASCYRTSLELAAQNGVRTIAFSSVSTGVYHFPPEEAAGIAVRTVFRFALEHPGVFSVIEWAVIDAATQAAYQKAIDALPQA